MVTKIISRQTKYGSKWQLTLTVLTDIIHRLARTLRSDVFHLVVQIVSVSVYVNFGK